MASIKKLRSGATPCKESGDSEFSCQVNLQFGQNGAIQPNYDPMSAVSSTKATESRY